MKKLIIIFFLISLFENSYSQVSREWYKVYNGPASTNDVMKNITVDISGNIIVTGRSNGTGSGGDYATLKYSPSGSLLWTQRFNGQANTNDEAIGVVTDALGNIYVTGACMNDSSLSDFVTIKYNPDGTQMWFRRFDNPFISASYEVAASIFEWGGKIYITGYSGFAGDASHEDMLTIAYDSFGDTLWYADYSFGTTTNQEYAGDIAVDNNGNAYITGVGVGIGGNNDALTVKYTPGGMDEWAKYHNGPTNNSDRGFAITTDNNGNVYVAGTESDGADGLDYVVIKYNSAGDTLWTGGYKGFAQGSTDVPVDIAVDNSGNVFVTGTSGFSIITDYATVKFNSAGARQWVRRYNRGTADIYDQATDLALDNTGNVYVTGTTGTIKYTPNGDTAWKQTYDDIVPALADTKFSIALDNQNNVYVGGSLFISSASASDYVLIKYAQTTGIQNYSNEIPFEYSLQQNYPNPFNPVTKIRFNIPAQSFVKIKVFDVTGKEIALLANESLNTGSYETGWDASSMPSGVYYCRMETQGFIKTMKMILVK